MREIRPSGLEGGARFDPSFLPLSAEGGDGVQGSPWFMEGLEQEIGLARTAASFHF
jgi:hypothetical protein